jgi:hypothetical protein
MDPAEMMKMMPGGGNAPNNNSGSMQKDSVK